LQEVELIEQFDSSLILQEEEATVDRVLRCMEESSWVHLACYADEDSSSLTKSAFCLHNGDLPLSKIITKSLRYADFAFLSACCSTTPSEDSSDEAVNWGAMMLAAGYRSVIATTGPIRDADAPLIVGEVYSRLLSGSAPDSTMAAHALHHAVKQLRERLEKHGSPSSFSWVPFIHVGK